MLKVKFFFCNRKKFKIEAGKTYDFLVTTKDPIKSFDSFELKWERDSVIPSIGRQSISPESIFTFSGEYQFGKTFCDSDDGVLYSKSSHTFKTAC